VEIVFYPLVSLLRLKESIVCKYYIVTDQ
jgi:hypothetical protein